MSETGKRATRPGRPRSEQSRQAIHAAVLGIVEASGYGALTMDGIAAEAGVGKQTLYRWWPSRGAMTLEVLRALATEKIPNPDTGSLRRDLVQFLSATFELTGSQPAVLPILRGLMAEAQLDPPFLQQLQDELIEPRRAALRELFHRAKSRGELRPRCDVELCIDLAFGVLWYRLLTSRTPLTSALAQKLAEVISREALRAV
ncbi:Transcriptional regulator, TetR family [Labilithrix luteola]|uniref:Transcriptional regulator, TetR family n=1 Tax=Labilithrix luteola TaxID=1391654 RepID=A0A0K1PSC1_9BACT|nr:TetR/AcrR family transcriptional regulator [Labilithrix luteola]AKU96029.1 Transcriptional regulator, TetR family [Labilithrix luteola]